MTTYLSKEVAAGLAAAQKKSMARKSRLRVGIDERRIPILKMWDNGFSVDRTDAPNLRGLVDLYDGARHLCQCLIVASEDDGLQMRYDFKRNTEAHDQAPLDFVKDEDAPIALLGG